MTITVNYFNRWTEGKSEQLEKWYDLVEIPIEPYKPPINGVAKFCPALTMQFKNVFAVRCPFKIKMKWNGSGIELLEPYAEYSITDQAFDKFVNIQTNFGPFKMNDGNPFVQFYFNYIFSCEGGLYVEHLPPFYEYRPDLPIRQSMGRWNISNWSRPMHFGFEWVDRDKIVSYNRGDICFYIRFLTNEDVELKRIKPSEELLDQIDKESNLKNHIRHFTKDMLEKNQHKERFYV